MAHSVGLAVAEHSSEELDRILHFAMAAVLVVSG